MTQHDDLNRPGLPPDVVLRPGVRSATLMTFLGGIVLLFLLVGAALLFWVATDRVGEIEGDEPAAVGTSGEPRSHESPGGFDPAPSHEDTREELDYRGFGDKKD
jgi:hypothetical protein